MSDPLYSILQVTKIIRCDPSRHNTRTLYRRPHSTSAESSPKGPRTRRSGVTERAMQQCVLRFRARSLHREVTRGEVSGTVAGSSPTGLRLFSAALAPASGARQGYCTCPGYSGLEMLVKCVQGPLRYINVVQCPPPRQRVPTGVGKSRGSTGVPILLGKRPRSLRAKRRRCERNYSSGTEKTGLECTDPQEEWPSLVSPLALSARCGEAPRLRSNYERGRPKSRGACGPTRAWDLRTLGHRWEAPTPPSAERGQLPSQRSP